MQIPQSQSISPLARTAAMLLVAAFIQGCVSAKSTPVAEAEPAAPAPEPAAVVVPVGDGDGDGVLNDIDECPNTRAGVQVDARGCEIILSINGPLFEFDKSTLTAAATAKLTAAALVLENNPAKSVQVAGHTDSVGSDAYNIKLGMRRAESVRSFLVQRGIDPGRLSTQTYGESEPVASNETDAGRAQNRRVELVDLTQ